MNKKEKNIIFFIIFLLLGIVATVQIRTTLVEDKKSAEASLNISKLMQELEVEKEIGKNLNISIKGYEKEQEEALKHPVDNEEFQFYKSLSDRYKFLAGFTDVKGPGITVTLNDALAFGVLDESEYLIHDSDITEVLNEIKKVGAQAISINNERLIANSEQVCAGPTIKINKNRYSAPYEIKAIGNPDEMKKALETSNIILSLKLLNLRVDISSSKEIKIPGYNGKENKLITGLEVVGNEIKN